MRSLTLIVAFAAASYYCTDAHPAPTARNALFPLIFLFSLVALALRKYNISSKRSNNGGTTYSRFSWGGGGGGSFDAG